jgi:hypothetical protein
MPDRTIRQSARTSPTLDALSDGAERMFWRLTTVADDYGRFDADPRVLLAGCFPLRVGRLSSRKVAGWLQEMVQFGAVVLYEVDGRRFGYFVKWRKYQHVRAKRSRFPDPPPASKRQQIPTSADTSSQASADASVVTSSTGKTSSTDEQSDLRETTSAPNDAEDPSASLQAVFTLQGFVVPPLLTDRWKTAYPAVDVKAEICAAFEWTQANPARRKSNWTRFLVNWLKRAQDKARVPGLSRPARAVSPEEQRRIDGMVERWGNPAKESIS